MLRLRKPYLLFLGDVQDRLTAKTAFGLKDWCGEDVVGEWSLPGCSVTLGLARVSPQERGQGAKDVERMLFELAYELEAASPWAHRIPPVRA